MKKIMTSVLAAVALSTSAMAFDLVGEDESVIIRFGADAEGKDYNSQVGNINYPGSPTAGRTGVDRDAAYEFAIDIEKNVADGEWGTKKSFTLYDHGDAIRYDGKVSRETSNIGLDFTYSVYYKVNEHFKPYVGGGFGINQRKRTGELANSAESTNYEPTLNAVIGVSGEIYKNFGYYVEYKYRFADNVDDELVFVDPGAGGLPIADPDNWHRVDADGVDGGQIMIGISYKF